MALESWVDLEKKHNMKMKEMTLPFSKQIVETCRKLKKDHHQSILANQLLRSGTSIGAMVREAEYAESRRDFIHKHQIAQKEINESLYWLEVILAGGYIPKSEFDFLHEQQRNSSKSRRPS